MNEHAVERTEELYKIHIADLERQLAEAQQAIRIHLVEMDKLMSGPSTRERGMAIAAQMNTLRAILGEKGA